jgi:integrase
VASIQKHGDGWRALVRRKGITKTKKFTTKAQAVAWAAREEAEIIESKSGAMPRKSLGELLDRYAESVSVNKAGERWERIRINLFKQDKIASVMLPDLNQSHFADWRDRRLKVVSASTVRREWNLLSNACTVAMNEWKWLREHPMKGVSKPAPPASRDRRVSQDEIKAIQFALGYVDGHAETKSQRVALAFEFACETAMRAQEICNLKLSDIRGNTATIRKSKTRAGIRVAPLTNRAVDILKLLPDENLFDLTTSTLDALFRKARDKAGRKQLPEWQKNWIFYRWLEQSGTRI